MEVDIPRSECPLCLGRYMPPPDPSEAYGPSVQPADPFNEVLDAGDSGVRGRAYRRWREYTPEVGMGWAREYRYTATIRTPLGTAKLERHDSYEANSNDDPIQHYVVNGVQFLDSEDAWQAALRVLAGKPADGYGMWSDGAPAERRQRDESARLEALRRGKAWEAYQGYER